MIYIFELTLTKLTHEYLNLALSVKKERYKHRPTFFASLELDFFEFSSSLLMEYCCIFSTLEYKGGRIN